MLSLISVDTEDNGYRLFLQLPVVAQLCREGALGQKAGASHLPDSSSFRG